MRQYRTLFAVTTVLLFAASALRAQMRNDHVEWELLTPTVSGKPGEVVDVRIRLTVAPGAHLYSLRRYPEGVIGPVPTTITAGDTVILKMTGDVASDVPPTKKKDSNFDDLPTEFWKGTVTLTIPVTISEQAEPGEHTGWVGVYFMTCTDRYCRAPTDERFPINVRVGRT